MVDPVPPICGAEGLAINTGLPVNGVQSTKKPRVKTIVTFFDKARSPYDSHRDDSKPVARSSIPFVAAFSPLFEELVPTFTEQSTKSLGPGIAQAVYSSDEARIPDCSTLRRTTQITDFETKHNVEIILDQFPCPSSSFQRPLKLALFDMDSTLINEEVIDELARSVGVSDAVSAITARAMNGDIDFATSLKERVGMLKGVPTTVWEDLKRTVTIAEGARELIAGLKRKGVYCAVASGGFTPMAEWLKGELGLDLAVANHLLEEAPTEEFPYAHLSGQLDPAYPLVTPQLKKDTLVSLAAAHSVKMHETLAVGDGSNDLLMLGTAGLGIAWRAKEKVQIAAPMRLNGKSLADLLYLLGPEE